VIRFTDDGFLGRKVTVTRQLEFVLVTRNLDDVRDIHHVATHALKIVRLHCDHRVQLYVRNAELVLVNVEHFQEESGICVFVRVFDPHTKLVTIITPDEKGDDVHVCDGFRKFEQVVHVQAHLYFFLARVRFEPIPVQLQMNQRDVRAVHRH
jgi:hypothetical protein